MSEQWLPSASDQEDFHMADDKLCTQADLTAARNAGREEMREAAVATFQDEYCKHNDCLIGVIRALGAIRTITLPPKWECPNADHACNLRGYCVNKNCDRFTLPPVEGGTPTPVAPRCWCATAGDDTDCPLHYPVKGGRE